MTEHGTAGHRARAATSRTLAAFLALATLVAIGWYACRSLPQGRLTPGFRTFLLTFSSGLALPYLIALALLARHDGRDGLRLALATALVNAAWALPLGALLVLFGGFTMGNRDQIEQIAAVAGGALLQLPLLAVAYFGIRRISTGERGTGTGEQRRSLSWLVAFVLPIAASGASWAYFQAQLVAIPARAERARANDRAARETIRLLQDCLASHREQGYPKSLEACPAALAPSGAASGYRFEYLPALPDADVRIGAYLICARPLRFRETGYEVMVADSAGTRGAGLGTDANADAPPTCASVLDAAQAIRHCAYAHAAREPARGYPARLADIASCVAEGRTLAAIGADVLTTEPGNAYAYLAEPPDESGRVTRFRVYLLRDRAGLLPWIDERGVARALPQDPSDAALDALPERAAPEGFARSCERERREDCFLAGYEWQRRARQTAQDARDPSVAPLQERALQAFEHGCALGDARSCEWLANGIEDGIGAAREPARALSLHERACDLADPEGCRSAAAIHERVPEGGSRQTQGASRAVAFYQRACDLDDAEACFIAARLLAAGEGIEPDPPRALALFARLCDDGFAIACARAAALAPERQGEYRRRACVLGDADACP